MKVKELIKLLEKCNEEDLVIIANHSDYEDFSILTSENIREKLYYEDKNYGSFVLDKEEATMYDRERSENAVVLYPSVVTIPNW